MSKDAIFERIRTALATGQANDDARNSSIAKRRIHPPIHPRPAIAGLDGAEREARMLDQLQAQGAEVTLVETLASLPAAVAASVKSLGPGATLVTGDDSRFTTLSWPHGTNPRQWTVEQPLGDGFAALTHAEAGVAETGTLVFESSARSPASLAFLPELHIVALHRNTIVAAFEDAFAHLSGNLGQANRWPRSINLISGPSRTGDIGGRIVKGAHGPRRLAVIVYG